MPSPRDHGHQTRPVKHFPRSIRWFLLIALAGASLQCNEDKLILPPEGTPTDIELISGDHQTAVVGTPLADSLIVRLTDSKDRPVADTLVTFKLVGSNAGTDFIPDTARTDTDGRARAKWVLGQTVGDQEVQAVLVAGTLKVTFQATATAGPATTLTAVRGDQQTGQVGTALADSLVVKVTDQFGNPVSGFSVSWSAHGGGTVSAATVNTGANGQAAVQRVLGNTAGPQSAEADAAGLNGSPLVFTHTAGAGSATTMVKDPVTDGQFGVAGLELTDSIVVIVKDANGNGVAGRSVLWTIATGGGTVNPTTSTTDTDGKAFTRWTLGPTAGTNTVNAASANLTPVTFTATATAAQPSKIVAVSTVTQSGAAGSPVGAPPSVKVTDANGNPVQGETVTFTVTAGGGTVSDGTASGTTTTVATNSSGIATLSDWTLGPTVGGNSVAASALDVSNNPLTGSPVFFNATGQAGAASKLAMSIQPSTSAQSGVVLAVQPVIQLQDALGNPVAQSGKQVTVSVTGGGATLAGTLTVSTNANGTATFSGLALSGPVGSYTLTFTASGLTSAVSGSILLSAGAAARLIVATQPSSSAQSGVPFAQQPVIQVADVAGNPVSSNGVSVTAAIATGGGTLTGIATKTTNAQGLATFTDLAISGTVGPRVLNFSAAGLSNASANVALTAGGAATLAIQAGDNQTATAGSQVAVDPAVLVTDGGGNPVAGVAVTFAVATGGGSIGGANAVTDASGIAEVGGWTLGPITGPNTLTATSAGLSGSPVTFHATGTAGSAGKLAIKTQPSSTAQSGARFAQQPAIQLQDQNGNNLQLNGVAISADVSAGTLNGNTTVATVNGVATFTNLSITGTIGNYTLTFSGASLTGVTSNSISLSAGAPAQLVVTTQPSTQVQSGIAFPQQPVVQIQDAAGNPASVAKTILATLRSGGGTLGGTTSINTGGGSSVTFTNLAVSGLVGPRTLLFASGGLTSDTSSTFTVIAGNAAQIAAASAVSQSAPVGAPVTSAPSVVVKDGAGNPVAGVTVTFAITQGGGSLNGATQTTNASGVATVTDWTLGPLAGTNTVTATATGSGISGNPVSFNATGTASGATHLSITTQPSSTAQSGAVFAAQPVIQLRDANGNAVSQAGVSVTVTASGGTLGGTASATTNASGVATFSGLSISGLVGSYTLTFQSTGLASVTSGNIALSAGAAATIATSAGDAQSAPVGMAVPIDPAVLVTDGAGNPVAGRSVTFAVATGGGSITGGNATTNASGIATVGSWTLGATAGPNTLTATSAGLGGSPLTFTATGTTGSATQLAITTQPSATAQSGIDIATQPVVRLRDGNGNNVSQANVDITATVSTGGTLAGTLTVPTNASGVASFTDLAISGVVGNYTLSFDATGLTGATSSTIALTAGTAAKLGVNRQPSGTAQSGVAIVVQPRIQIQDAAGNSVSQAGTTITASFASGTGTLTNETATTSGAGLATFAGLAITGTVGSYTLQYDAGGLTGVSSNPITLNPGPANHVTITVQPPPTASSGVALSTQPVVQLRDGAGNAVSQGGTSITASIASGTGGSLGNTVATTDATGEATFSGLTLSGPAGNFTLRFGGTGLTAAVSNTIALGAGSGSVLFIQTQPGATAQNGVDFAQQPVIQLRDASNNPVNQPGVVVSASILSGGGTLNGTTTATTNASGVASFNDLAITGVVGSRTLIFSASGFVSATSSAINLTAGAATQLGLTTQPSSSVQSGVVFPTQPVVQLKDQSGNNVSQSNVSVDVAIATGGGTLDGTFPINTDASGQAAFTDLAITGTPGAHTLTFSSSGLSSVTSGSMSVTSGLPNHLSITTQPSATVQNSVAFPQQPAIQLRDGAGNPVSQNGVQVTASIASGGGTIGGTATVNTNASGLATFGNLKITGTAGNRTLQFTSGTLTSVASGTIDIVAGAAATIDVSAGDGQSADAGTPVAVPPRVVVADVSGNPVSGVNVTFAVATGGGSAVPTAPVATDVNGLAAVTSWTLGNNPGPNTLKATSGGLSGSPVTFTATGVTGAPAQLTITTQPSSAAQNAIAFPRQPVLQLQDAAGNPVSQNGVQVTASIASGGGSLGGSTLTVNTDFNGVATFPDLEITGTVGNHTLNFASSGLTGATSSTISLVAGDPVSIVAQAGDNQSATVDQDVTTPPTVLVTDLSGNPVKDVTVDFAVESGGGSIAGQHPKTDPNGLAGVSRWTLGTTSGTNTLSATSGGLTGSPVIFTATGTPDVADAAQSTASVPNGTILVQTVITIQARDQFGNALTSGGSDVEVTVTGTNSANATVTDEGDGTYSATYLPVLPGADTITITLDGAQISGSPFTSNVGP